MGKLVLIFVISTILCYSVVQADKAGKTVDKDVKPVDKVTNSDDGSNGEHKHDINNIRSLKGVIEILKTAANQVIELYDSEETKRKYIYIRFILAPFVVLLKWILHKKD